MICNVYDFDNTVFRGDSTLRFFIFCLCRHWKIFKLLPNIILHGLYYKLGKVTKYDFKKLFYQFLTLVPDIEQMVELYWEKNTTRINQWYLAQKRPMDIIISASPSFLLKPIADNLAVRLIASEVDPITGICIGYNCWGEEKVNRFKREYPNWKILEFYSDSYSDQPLANLSQKAYFVYRNKKIIWEKDNTR